jgi:Gamma-glutamyl cyclotransferase, AIG2-like
MNRKVWTFWYGSYMNPAVLAEVNLRPDSFQVARLDGYDIRIEPLANLLPTDGASVYGLLAEATHEELDRLYAHARNVLGAVYLPEAVLVQTRESTWRPALCFIATTMEPRPADRAYVERILRPARDFGFPSWYVEKIERFLP